MSYQRGGHPKEIQRVWICKLSENGNPPEITQTIEIKHVFPDTSGLGQSELEELEPLRQP